MKLLVLLTITLILFACGQGHHLTLENENVSTPPELNLSLSAPVGPFSTNLNESIVGSCGSEASNGSVVITTNPANGFTTNYGVPIALDSNGEFNFPTNWVTDTPYELILDCENRDGIKGSKIFGPVGIATISINNPGHIFLGKMTTFSGTCSPLMPDGDVELNIDGATPNTLNCPCVSGVFNCPAVRYNTLPRGVKFGASYLGAISDEMGFSSCPPYTPPTNSGREDWYQRTNTGNVNAGYVSGSNFTILDGFGQPSKGGGSRFIRNIPNANYAVVDINNNNNREINFSGVTFNIPGCLNNVAYDVGDSIVIRYRP